MHLSTVGYVHTIFGLIGVVLAFYMLIRNRKIDPKSFAGTAYFVAVTVSCILVFALPRNAPGFNRVPGHVLTLLALTSLLLGFFIHLSNIRAGRYIEALGLSGSFFFSMVPAINETPTRLPVGAPLASSPQGSSCLEVIRRIGRSCFGPLRRTGRKYSKIRTIVNEPTYDGNRRSELQLPLTYAGLAQATHGRDGGIRFSRSANSITRREIYNAVIGEKSLWAPRAVPHQCFVSSNDERYFVGLAGNAHNAAVKTLDREDLADSLAELRILDGSAHA